jgi:ribosomal protein S18 acetylase RimI-like enzyme
MVIQEFTQTVEGDITVYLIANGPAGAIGMLRLSPDGFIKSLFVKEEYRQGGIGTQLMEAALVWCCNNKLESVGLWVSDSNLLAQKLYRRLGFLKYVGGHEGYTQYVRPLSK